MKIWRCRGLFFLIFCAAVTASPVWSQSPSAGRPGDLIDMVIVLDRSGSMKATDPQGLSIPAAAFLLEQLDLSNDGNRGAVVPFSDEAGVLGRKNGDSAGALSSNLMALAELLVASGQATFSFRENSPDDPAGLLSLVRAQMHEGGETELGKALELAQKILRADEPGRRKIVVLISDGMPEPNVKTAARLRELEPAVGTDVVNRLRKGQGKRNSTSVSAGTCWIRPSVRWPKKTSAFTRWPSFRPLPATQS